MKPLQRARRTVAACEASDTRDRILAFVDEHPDALLRSCDEAHLTSSAIVVDHEGEHVLLLLHAKLGRWLQPGGHCDGDGDLARVALREATEETGIDGLTVSPGPIALDVHPFDQPGHPVHLHLDVRYLCTAPPGARPRGNDESREVRWFTWDETETLELDDELRRLLRSLRPAAPSAAARDAAGEPRRAAAGAVPRGASSRGRRARGS